MFLSQYWDSLPVPDDVAALLRSHREVNAGMLEQRCFDREAARAFLGARFGARELAAFEACAVPAMQADYFRICAVLADGGFYSDADTICQLPLLPLLGTDDGVLFQRPNGNVINGLFAFRQPGHPFLRAALELATSSIERRICESVWITTGPGVFTFLWLLSTLSVEEREHIDFDAIDPEVTLGMRLADELARRDGWDLVRMFEGVRIGARTEVDAAAPDGEVAYKATERHWTQWGGSIFAA